MGRKCNCQKPPGGGIDCPFDSLAICRLVNGECKGYCREVPSGLNKLELNNWVLTEIKEEYRSLNQELSFEDQNILYNKLFITTSSDGTRMIIRFDFPNTDEIGTTGRYNTA